MDPISQVRGVDHAPSLGKFEAAYGCLGRSYPLRVVFLLLRCW